MGTNDMVAGLWHSRYEYGRGPKDDQYSSEHLVRFAEVNGEWVGTSEAAIDGSQVFIKLTQDGHELSGQWREITSPSGHYHGREFNGLITLLLQQGGTELNGLWLGVGSSISRVKSGPWRFKRNVRTDVSES
jgi:hypothetical protein